MSVPALPPLMYVTSRRLMGTGPEIVDTLAEALWSLPPESVLVYVREPDLDGLALTELVRAFMPVVHAASQRLVLRERVDIGKFVGADGVHLPENSFRPDEVRQLWPSAILGRSLHDVAMLASPGDVDYVTLSPLFETDSHPGTPPLGMAALEEARKSKVPLYALGGIDEANATSVLATGVHGVAMMRAAWRRVAPL
ncbi:MAG: thiamine phosphate synthase [Deltaproteobacteria bacterium]|nr:thiamine phosphate synthase [Deltaproteobacteria bacterium]